MPKGHSLSEATKDAIWELRALGISEAEVGRRLGLPGVTVSRYVASLGGIRPRPRRRAARCLRLAEREEISRRVACGESARQIARALGRSHTTIARELNRCGGRRRYRAHAAERQARRRARRSRPSKLELCGELRRVVIERLEDDNSPEQIAGWLRLTYPDNESMRLSLTRRSTAPSTFRPEARSNASSPLTCAEAAKGASPARNRQRASARVRERSPRW